MKRVDEFIDVLKSEGLFNERTQIELEKIIEFAKKIADSNFKEKEAVVIFLEMMPKMEYLLGLRQQILEKKTEKFFKPYI